METSTASTNELANSQDLSTSYQNSSTIKAMDIIATTDSLQDHDALIFGSVNQDLTDALADSVTRCVKEGVQSLPLLNDPVKAQALAARITKPYLRNIDIIEAYGDRNIFTLRKLQPRRRQRFLQLFLDPAMEAQAREEDPSFSNSSLPSTLSSSASSDKSSPPTFPSSQGDIPTPSDIAALQDQLTALTTQLEQAQTRRTSLMLQAKSLETAQSFLHKVQDVVDQANLKNTAIHNSNAAGNATNQSSEDALLSSSVMTVVMGAQGVQDMTAQGRQLQKKLPQLQKRKEQDSGSDVENNAPWDSVYPSLPKKTRGTLTVEQMYHQDRKLVNTTVENLSAFSKLLKASTAHNTKA